MRHPARALRLAIALLWLMAAGVHAHGGVPTLQLGAERISPGGTIEVLGDMTTEGTVALRLVGGTTVRSLGDAVADYEGHFQVFVIVPADIPTGAYTVHAESEVESPSAPLVVAGFPIGGEEGQLPGQDEARAPVVSAPGAGPATGPVEPSAVTGSGSNWPPALIAIAIAIVGALGLGWIVRARLAPARRG